jgi:hypothetical protein
MGNKITVLANNFLHAVDKFFKGCENKISKRRNLVLGNLQKFGYFG